MRSALTTMVGLTLFAAACGGTSNTTSSAGSTTGPAATTGGSTTGGTTTGGSTTGATTTGGTTNGGLPDGTACTSDSACGSGVCGINGSGNCCSIACTHTASGPAAVCGAVACDTGGNCVYPVVDAGAILCSGTCNSKNSELIGFYCDTSGNCSVSTGVAAPCLGNYACADGASCKTTCSTLSDCAKDFNCVAGQCVPQIGNGPCTENDACLSLVCDINGTGNCCKNACAATADPLCAATSCDATTAACIYPNGSACGAPTCVNSKESGGGTCNANGNCITVPVACQNNLGCNAAGTQCNTSCTTVADCANGFYCNNDAGGCIQQTVNGPCFENAECTSGVCGTSGSGNCCSKACATTDPICGATDCDGTSGACDYPPTTTLCGTVAASCAAGTEQDPSACDGNGACNNNPGMTACTPFICGATACLTTCTDTTSCVGGAFCDIAGSACCDALGANPVISVDAANGDDTKGCCGVGTNTPCQTLSRAMALIDSAGATGATINATIKGGGGDWAPAGETYPIVLGWGVELNGAGVFFSDSNGNNEIFDINNYSANDTVGSASIVGTAKAPVNIGMTKSGTQSTDSSAIQVENGNTLSIANANLNGNAGFGTNAITVAAGGTLMLGQDSAAAITGTVTIGNATNDGWNGIVCQSTNTLGCTINDATLTGSSSLVIENQEDMAIDAEDNAVITLASAPTVGIAPTKVGFLECPSKNDESSSNGEAILLNGTATMTFSNGTVQCIAGDGFALQASPNGSPTLNLASTIIQNTEFAVVANAGTANVSKSTIRFNYNGVEQADGATVDLSGGTAGGTNDVACSNSGESVFYTGDFDMTPAVVVLNLSTSAALNASNCDWDTTTPDLFSCDSTLTSCTCQSAQCTLSSTFGSGGIDGMDAVYEQSQAVTTTTNGNSKDSCQLPCGGLTSGVTCGGDTPACCFETTGGSQFGGVACCSDTIADCFGPPNFCD